MSDLKFTIGDISVIREGVVSTVRGLTSLGINVDKLSKIAFVNQGSLKAINENPYLLNFFIKELVSISSINYNFSISNIDGAAIGQTDAFSYTMKLKESLYFDILNSVFDSNPDEKNIQSFWSTFAHESLHAIEGDLFRNAFPNSKYNIFAGNSDTLVERASNYVRIQAVSEGEAYSIQGAIENMFGFKEITAAPELAALNVINQSGGYPGGMASNSAETFIGGIDFFNLRQGNLHNNVYSITYGNQQQKVDISGYVGSATGVFANYRQEWLGYSQGFLNQEGYDPNSLMPESTSKIQSMSKDSYYLHVEKSTLSYLVAKVSTDFATKLTDITGRVLFTSGSASGGNDYFTKTKIFNTTLKPDATTQVSPVYSIGSNGTENHVVTTFSIGKQSLNEFQGLKSTTSVSDTFYLSSGGQNMPYKDVSWSIDGSFVKSEVISFAGGKTTVKLRLDTDEQSIAESSNHSGTFLLSDESTGTRVGIHGFTLAQIDYAVQNGVAGQYSYKGDIYQSEGQSGLRITLPDAQGSRITLFGNANKPITIVEDDASTPTGYKYTDVIGGRSLLDPTPEILTAENITDSLGIKHASMLIGGGGATTMLGAAGINFFYAGIGATNIITALNATDTIHLDDATAASTDTIVLAGNDTVSGGSGTEHITALKGSNVTVQQSTGTVDIVNAGASALQTSGGATFNITDSHGEQASGGHYHSIDTDNSTGYSLEGYDNPGEDFSARGSARFLSIIGELSGSLNVTFGSGGGDINPSDAPSRSSTATASVIGGNGAENHVDLLGLGGSSAFIGGSAIAYAESSSGGHSLIYGGTASSSGPDDPDSKTILFGEGAGDQLYADGSAGEILISSYSGDGTGAYYDPQILSSALSAGNDELLGNGSGNDIMIAGHGNDTFIMNGGTDRTSLTYGSNTVSLVKGNAGGLYTIAGFIDGFDKISLSGYDQSEIDGLFSGDNPTSSLIALSDGSRLHFTTLTDSGYPGDDEEVTAASFTGAVSMPENMLAGNTSVSGDAGAQTFTSDSGNGFARTDSGSNIIDFSAGNSGSRDVISSGGADTVTGGHGSVIATVTGNAHVTTQSDGNAVLNISGNNAVVLSQGNDRLNMSGTGSVVTVTGNAFIDGGHSANNYVLSGNDTLTSHAGDSIEITGGNSTVTGDTGTYTALSSGTLTYIGNSATPSSVTVSGQACVAMTGVDMTAVVLTGASDFVTATGNILLNGSEGDNANITVSGSATMTTSANGGSTVSVTAADSSSQIIIHAAGHDKLNVTGGQLTVQADNLASLTTSDITTSTVMANMTGGTVTLNGNDNFTGLFASSNITVTGTAYIADNAAEAGNVYNLSGNVTLVNTGAHSDTLNIGSGNTTYIGQSGNLTINQTGGNLNITCPVPCDISTAAGSVHMLTDTDTETLEFILSDGSFHPVSGNSQIITLSGGEGSLDLIQGNADVDATNSSGASVTLAQNTNENVHIYGGEDTSVTAASGVDFISGHTGSSTLDMSAASNVGTFSYLTVDNATTVKGGSGVIDLVGVQDTDPTVTHVFNIAMGLNENLILDSLDSTAATITVARGNGSETVQCSNGPGNRQSALSIAFSAGITQNDISLTSLYGTDLVLTLLDAEHNPTTNTVTFTNALDGTTNSILNSMTFSDGTSMAADTVLYAPGAVTAPVQSGSMSFSISGTDNAQFTVMVDGVQKGGVFTATAQHGTGTQTLVINGISDTVQHNISISLLNPDGGNRQLFVENVSDPGTSMNVSGSQAVISSADAHHVFVCNPPDLAASGSVASLSSVMAADAILKLKVDTLISMSVQDEMISAQEAVTNILLAWTGSDTISPNSAGFSIDGRWTHALQALYGTAPSDMNGSDTAWGNLVSATAGKFLATTQAGISLGLVTDASGNVTSSGSRADVINALTAGSNNITSTADMSGYWSSAAVLMNYLDTNVFSTDEVAAGETMAQILADTPLAGYVDALNKPLDMPAGFYYQRDNGSSMITTSDTGNVMSVGSGNHIVIGGAGNDLFRPGAGQNLIDLGAGHNTLTEDLNYVASVTDMRPQDTGGSGTSTLADGSVTTFSNVQDITGTRGSNVIWGDSQDNLLVAIGTDPNAPPSQVHGGAGNDTIYLYDNLNPWLGHDPADAWGDDGNDTVIGNEADNHLYGGNGDDIIYGNGGNDVLVGGQGNDLLDGGWGYDIADYSSDPAGIHADLAWLGRTQNGWYSHTTDGWGTQDTLVDIERVVGTPFMDFMGAGQGDMTFCGGEGSDTYAFRPWSGNLIVVDGTGLAGLDVNVLELQGAGFDPAGYSMTRSGDNAVLSFGNTGSQVTLWGQYAGGAAAASVQQLKFDDAGVTVDLRTT